MASNQQKHPNSSDIVGGEMKKIRLDRDEELRQSRGGIWKGMIYGGLAASVAVVGYWYYTGEDLGFFSQKNLSIKHLKDSLLNKDSSHHAKSAPSAVVTPPHTDAQNKDISPKKEETKAASPSSVTKAPLPDSMVVPSLVEHPQKKTVVSPQEKKTSDRAKRQENVTVRDLNILDLKEEGEWESLNIASVQTYGYSVADGGGPIIQVSAGDVVEVSRQPSFSSLYVKGSADRNGKFRITTPPPGEWYWRVKSKGDIHQITVTPAASTGVHLVSPTMLSINDYFVWESSHSAVFYRFQASETRDGLEDNTAAMFSTTKKVFPVALLGDGSWFVRVGALNHDTAMWEWSTVYEVSVGSG